MRGRIIRDHALVHSKIEATQAHEIRHFDMVNGRSVVALLIRNDVIARTGGISTATGRADGVENRYAILDQRNVLRSKRNLDMQLFRRRTAAEENLSTAPLPGLGRQIQGEHFIPAGYAIPISARSA